MRVMRAREGRMMRTRICAGARAYKPCSQKRQSRQSRQSLSIHFSKQKQIRPLAALPDFAEEVKASAKSGKVHPARNPAHSRPFQPPHAQR